MKTHRGGRERRSTGAPVVRKLGGCASGVEAALGTRTGTWERDRHSLMTKGLIHPGDTEILETVRVTADGKDQHSGAEPTTGTETTRPVTVAGQGAHSRGAHGRAPHSAGTARALCPHPLSAQEGRAADRQTPTESGLTSDSSV